MRGTITHMSKVFDDQLIVVTGAAGFIGSCVVRLLNDAGYSNLLLVDDFKHSPKWKNLTRKKYVDIISRHDIFDWLKGREQDIEAFIHLGACSDTVETDGDYFLKTNYRFTVKLAEYALTNKHRFIYASSAATYGDGQLGFSDSHGGLDRLEPLNIYGYSKHMADLWMLRQNVLDQVVGLKYFNVFGPNEYHKGRMGSMVMHMLAQIQRDGKVRLFKSNHKDFDDGEQQRDFIYVKDAARLTIDFLGNDLGGIFNIGCGKAVSWNRLAKAVFAALGKPANIEYVDMPDDLKKNYQNYTCADMTKYSSARPFETQSVEDAVADYIQNYLLPGLRW